MIKDAEEHTGWGPGGTRAQRFCPRGLGVAPSQYEDVLSTRKLSEPPLWRLPQQAWWAIYRRCSLRHLGRNAAELPAPLSGPSGRIPPARSQAPVLPSLGLSERGSCNRDTTCRTRRILPAAQHPTLFHAFASFPVSWPWNASPATWRPWFHLERTHRQLPDLHPGAQ